VLTVLFALALAMCILTFSTRIEGSFGFSADDDDLLDYENAAVDSTSNDFDIVLKNAARAALRKGLVSSPDDLLVVTAGIPFGTPGAANVIRIMPAAGPNCWDGICQASD